MFGLDTLFIIWAVSGAAAAAASRNNNDRHRQEPSFGNTSNFSSSSSSRSSAFVHPNHNYVERRTIWDWWTNGLTGEERDILLENGYRDRSGCFSLEELNDILDRICFEKAPGKPTEKDGYKPNKKKGGVLVKNPNGKGRGWLDKDGNVWVPTGEGTGVHEPHWDVQKPDGGYDNVYPGGGIRPGKKH